jgi:hypothetical protein
MHIRESGDHMPENEQGGDLNLVALRDFARRIEDDQEVDARWKDAVRALLASGEIPSDINLLARLVKAGSDAST